MVVREISPWPDTAMEDPYGTYCYHLLTHQLLSTSNSLATKYPKLTEDFFLSRGVTEFKIVGSLGATESYPFTGSSELITDITSTGSTLKENNLRKKRSFLRNKL